MPKESTGPSYQATWAFAGIGLLVILFHWAVLTAANQPAAPAALPKPALGDAAQLIANCGKPDRDVITPARLKAPERRWLLFRSKSITAAFDRGPQKGAAAVWDNMRFFDHVSKRQLNQQQIAEKLPCAVASTRSQ